MNNILKEMQEYAKEFDVPIIEEDGIEIINSIIMEYNIKTILEIGTAIGYSALRMHICNDCQVTTVERDDLMYEKACEYIKRANKTKVIKLVHGDALLIDEHNFEKVDMLYIDAAKGQYIKFFEKYRDLVNDGGIVVFDNLLFHGFVDMEQHEIKNRNTRQLIRKLKEFLEYISNHEDYDFTLIRQGDGIGIAIRK